MSFVGVVETTLAPQRKTGVSIGDARSSKFKPVETKTKRTN